MLGSLKKVIGVGKEMPMMSKKGGFDCVKKYWTLAAAVELRF